MRVERAKPTDTPAVEALLTDACLPTEGAAGAFALGVVAREGTEVVGAAGIERYGEVGLLRSVVVATDHRHAGIGGQVVAAAERLARDEGVRELYLLTETAIDWFPRLGYEVVPRAMAASVVGESIEFTTVCKDRGVAMRKDLVRAAAD